MTTQKMLLALVLAALSWAIAIAIGLVIVNLVSPAKVPTSLEEASVPSNIMGTL